MKAFKGFLNKVTSSHFSQVNFKQADLHNLKLTLIRTPWDIVFDEECIDNSVSNLMDLFLTTGCPKKNQNY